MRAQRYGPFESYDRALEACQQLAAEVSGNNAEGFKIVCDYA